MVGCMEYGDLNKEFCDQGLHYLPQIQQFLDTSTSSKIDLFKF